MAQRFVRTTYPQSGGIVHLFTSNEGIYIGDLASIGKVEEVDPSQINTLVSTATYKPSELIRAGVCTQVVLVAADGRSVTRLVNGDVSLKSLVGVNTRFNRRGATQAGNQEVVDAYVKRDRKIVT